MMRKILFLALLILIALFMISCNGRVMKMLESSISYLEKHKLYGETEDFRIVVTVGVKEVIPIVDGIKGETADFVKIVLIPLKLGGMDNSYAFQYGEFSDKFSPDMIKYQLGAMLNYDKALNEIEITDNNDKLIIPLYDINDS